MQYEGRNKAVVTNGTKLLCNKMNTYSFTVILNRAGSKSDNSLLGTSGVRRIEHSIIKVSHKLTILLRNVCGKSVESLGEDEEDGELQGLTSCQWLREFDVECITENDEVSPSTRQRREKERRRGREERE